MRTIYAVRTGHDFNYQGDIISLHNTLFLLFECFKGTFIPEIFTMFIYKSGGYLPDPKSSYLQGIATGISQVAEPSSTNIILEQFDHYLKDEEINKQIGWFDNSEIQEEINKGEHRAGLIDLSPPTKKQAKITDENQANFTEKSRPLQRK